jgi:hypothetical protein
MAAYYTPTEERWLDERAEVSTQPGVELFKCSDGNFRDAEAKARFDEAQNNIRRQYGYIV